MLFLFYTCVSALTLEDSLTQSVPSVTEAEGAKVTLDSNYATSLSSYCLYWYRQLSERQPEYILVRCTSSFENKARTGFGNSFSAQLQKSNSFTSSSISELVVSDSAVFYCAFSLTTVIDCTASLVQKLRIYVWMNRLLKCVRIFDALRGANMSAARDRENRNHLTPTCQLNVQIIICHNKCRQQSCTS
uniref:Immunoglobulin V-set domain-containing protein n=1 Tax=Callorhinchus milii TaxID=7868 RepID=A0A4W3GJC0_CALMI